MPSAPEINISTTTTPPLKTNPAMTPSPETNPTTTPPPETSNSAGVLSASNPTAAPSSETDPTATPSSSDHIKLDTVSDIIGFLMLSLLLYPPLLVRPHEGTDPAVQSPVKVVAAWVITLILVRHNNNALTNLSYLAFFFLWFFLVLFLLLRDTQDGGNIDVALVVFRCLGNPLWAILFIASAFRIGPARPHRSREMNMDRGAPQKSV
ncbi:hypothetical protein DEU56DRAFT_464573 [Suillus clintonianus]|uniref:uncharacterized protein n=1 Tax=Suillus clintonianus TaxID=1904413 RepID=UPI001B868E9B|nr:uncharacterized protein DEU56DRAFT_464573 [Suillus clintonianus]KAG2130687.1 hypothetical protein DEU56DRAFT_464573 [Suillus clintonianus]